MPVQERPRHRPVPWRSEAWINYFLKRRESLLHGPGARGPDMTPAERDLLGPSLKVFQQGEAQEGGHFYRCARAYAEQSGDLAYAEAHRLFMDEERRHGRDLGHFLTLNDIPVLTERSWLTRMFCWCGS